MILTDSGPLVALLDSGEADHARCRDLLGDLTSPMLTSWPAFTESMSLLGRGAGWSGQEPLWRLVRGGDLVIADIDSAGIERTVALMRQYADRPMDLADATLLVLAEQRKLRRIFTLDSGFRIYQLQGRRHLDVVP